MLYQDSHGQIISITAEKEGIVGRFSVDVTDTPKFFQDRDLVLNSKGSKARIFHVRRAHVRNVDGKSLGVKMSFVGLREFKWNDYRIKITVPGRDAIPLSEFNEPFLDEDRMIEMGESLTGTRGIETIPDLIAGIEKDVANRRKKRVSRT
jgi:hypothetical protein